MTLVDARGRLFGRFNLVDTAIVGFVLFLLPVAYGTYLLFRPTRPQIESVARAEITREERRIGNGSALTAKFKVRGSGFTPLLRARIGGADALGFVFENPSSADILVGVLPAGAHDLVLMDGVQEVARAAGAIAIQETTGTPIRAAGWLTGLTTAAAAELAVGYRSPAEASSAFEIVALGPVRPGRSRMTFGGRVIDQAADGFSEREAVLTIRCDSPPLYDVCSIGGQSLAAGPPLGVTLPGPMSFQIDELLPMSAPTPAVAQVRLTGPAAALVRAGDRDLLLDSRAARVTAVGARDAGGVTVTLELGVDDSREGWRYRGKPIRPGGALALATDRYEISGQVMTVATTTAAGGAP